jgi:hypothetical protein
LLGCPEHLRAPMRLRSVCPEPPENRVRSLLQFTDNRHRLTGERASGGDVLLEGVFGCWGGGFLFLGGETFTHQEIKFDLSSNPQTIVTGSQAREHREGMLCWRGCSVVGVGRVCCLGGQAFTHQEINFDLSSNSQTIVTGSQVRALPLHASLCAHLQRFHPPVSPLSFRPPDSYCLPYPISRMAPCARTAPTPPSAPRKYCSRTPTQSAGCLCTHTHTRIASLPPPTCNASPPSFLGRRRPRLQHLRPRVPPCGIAHLCRRSQRRVSAPVPSVAGCGGRRALLPPAHVP